MSPADVPGSERRAPVDPATETAVAPATETSVEAGSGTGRGRRLLAEYAIPYLVALLVVPFVITGGHLLPWDPAMIDLDIYRLAVQDMLAGHDMYATTSPGWGLYFIYPPLAALLMIPLTIGPVWLVRLAWVALLVWAQQSVLRRCGVPRGLVLGLVGAGALVAIEPIRTTLGYGQVNTLLMAMVIFDLLPDRARRWPRGIAIGVAAAIKMTPALFGVFALFARRGRIAWTSGGTFFAVTLLAAAILPQESLRFWTGDIPAGTSGPQYVGNQSMQGMTTRFFGMSDTAAIAGIALGGLVCVLALVVGRHWWLTGHRVFAIALVGLATNLGSPLAWSHHFVWVLPLLVAVILDDGLPTWVRRVGMAWGIWISIQLPLTVLPYVFGAAEDYTFGQDLVANITPLVGLCLYLGLLVHLVGRPRGEAVARDEAIRARRP